MKRRVLSMVLCTFFVTLIAIPVIIKQVSKRQESIGAVTRHETVPTRYGFHF